ncbi:YgaP family membrane protein [Tistrella mobilis]|jgi:hypothetical protein|uniref:YgaP family membrane protein n=1 Tax=Tistrella mobilis TaxID=171437 RepID=UPI0035584543
MTEDEDMMANVGGLDRVLRIVVGLALLSMLLWGDEGWKWYGLIGLLPLATGLLRWCPAYTLFGIRTCPLARR